MKWTTMIAPWEIHTIPDRITRYSLIGSWLVIGYSAASIFIPGVPYWPLLALIALWVPLATIVSVRQYRHNKKAWARIQRTRQALIDDGHFHSLPAEDQEEIQISWAKYKLSEEKKD